MLDCQKNKDLAEITRQSVLRFESMNFKPALKAMETIKQYNVAPMIHAMGNIPDIDMRPMVEAVQRINEIDATGMLRAIETSRNISFDIKPTFDAMKALNDVNVAPMIRAMGNIPDIDMRPMVEAMQTLNNVNLVQLKEATKIINDINIQPMQEMLFSFSDQLTSLLDTINFGSIYSAYEKIRKAAEEHKIREDIIIQLLNDHQWFILPSMPLEFVHDIIDISTENDKRNKLNNHFFNYFASNTFENLINLVDTWDESGKLRYGRVKVIKDCLNAIVNSINGKIPSTMIVPALIAQIDGIQREFLIKNKFKPIWIKFKYEGEGKSMNQNDAWKYIYTPDDSFSEIANDVILDVLFASVLPGEAIKTPITFSRHKIMHGEHLNYGTKPNTIRTFLILDFLHELL